MRQLAWIARLILFAAIVVSASFASVGEANAASTSPVPFAGRWIDVNLTTLRATAFQGARAVYSTGVTTGKPGYRTPTGTYYIFSRYWIQDMRSNPGDPHPYFQPNVRYIQYFKAGGFALHANYWEPAWVFGRANTSHGCVGMPTSAAVYFWNFATIGTPVYIHYGPAPKPTPVVKVGSVVGKSLTDARAALQKNGLKVSVKNKTSMLDTPGTVLAQSVASGKTVAKGTTITLTVAQARALAPLQAARGGYAYAPDVVGLSEADAIARIEQAGLKATYINYFDQKSVPTSAKQALLHVRKGAVFGTLAAVGQRLPAGSDYEIAVRR